MMSGRPPMNETDPHAVPGVDGTDEPLTQSQSAYVTLLFNKYRGRLHKYLTRFVPPDTASELVQETYFRIVRMGGLVQLEALARALLFKTATNLARDHRRRRASHLADQHSSLMDEELLGDSTDPMDDLIGDQALGALERTLADMPDDVRRVFILCRFRELSYSEIGEVMGLSTRTVARKMVEAIERLSVALRVSV